MNLALVIYLISVADVIWVVSAVVMVVASIALSLSLLVHFLDGDTQPNAKIAAKCFGLTVAIATTVTALVPNQSTSYTMLAAYGGQSLIESDAAKRIAPKSLELIERTIDKHLKEME